MNFLMRMLPLILLFSACSLPVHTGGPSSLNQSGPSHLMQIHIESWGTPRFTGLLGLQFQDTGLTYMLLDATGITLLESQVTQNGDSTVIRAAGKLGDTGLPDFLAASLWKIYLIEPASAPCAGNLFLRFCMEKMENTRVRKYAATGPFTLWEAEFDSACPAKWPAVSFSEPWFGVSLTLTDLNRHQ